MKGKNLAKRKTACFQDFRVIPFSLFPRAAEFAAMVWAPGTNAVGSAAKEDALFRVFPQKAADVEHVFNKSTTVPVSGKKT